MSQPDLTRIVEAVLLAADSPVPLDRLTDIIEGAGRREVKDAIEALRKQFDEESHSFVLAEVAGGWQIYCKPEYSQWIRELHKGRIPTRLSQAALETLAIIAYKQPIVRAEIEAIRGVDSSGVLATLLRRSLITIAGRAPGMGRALMYRTTKEFLRYFGLNSVTDLPRLEEFAEVLGLKPDELELAVEGAESVAGVTGEVENGALPAGLAEGDHEPGEAYASLAAAEEDAQPETHVVPLTEPDEDGEREDEAPLEPALEKPGSSAARKTEPDGDSHAVGDRRILDEVDEA